MKKIVSLVMVGVMLLSVCPMVRATDVNYTQGTKVEYIATGNESYTITVPALMAPGDKGAVTLEGTWADSRTITVTADATVTLTNSIKMDDQKVLDITFAGISERGSNTVSQKFTTDVAVSDIDNALFGKWSGKFNYNVDIVDAPVLDGNGQTYHKMAPSTLSFRSTAPLNEFQEVRVNGEVVDPSNYTLTEGSTIVTLNIDYLETLDVDAHEITVVSNNGSPSAKFDVVAPSLNDYGFYYNQPYTTYFDEWSQDIVFFIREDGTMDIMFISITMGVVNCTYTINGTELIVHMPDGTDYHSTLLLDEQAIYCEELNETFRLDNERVAYDDEYLYFYDDFFQKYVVKAMDKSKTIYAPIKSNVHGVDVELYGTFSGCVNMVEAPKIPYGVTTIESAYEGCTSLVVAPEIPNGVEGMLGAFNGCTSLTTAPIIPSSVVDLSCAFYHCHNLTGEIEINTSNIDITNSNSYSDCFSDTIKEIIITGSASEEIKATLAGTAEHGNVRY